MAKERYEMTEADREDKKQYLNKLIKNAVVFGVLWLISNFKSQIGRFLDGISSFLGGLFDLAAFAVEIAMVVFLVLMAISAFNYLRRTNGYYEKRAEKSNEDNVKWLKRNRALVDEFRAFVEEVKNKTKRYGVDIFEYDISVDDFDEECYLDSKHWEKTGEAFLVYVTRLKNNIIISHFSPSTLRFMNLSVFLAVDCEKGEYAYGFVDYANDFKKSMRYIHDKRRDDGFFVITPVENVVVNSLGDGTKARLSYRSELGVEFIDICTPSSADYDNLARLLQR